MTEQLQIFRTVFETVWHHVPREQLPDAIMTGGGLAFAGVVLALWGAKLLRPIFALVFVGGGAWFGGEVAKNLQVTEVIGIVIGAVVLGVLGYVLYRFWIAGLSAVLVAAIALCIFVGRAAGPYWSAYNAPEEVTAFQVGGADIVQENGWETLVTSLQDFWTYLTYKQADLTKDATLLLCVAGLAGFFLGLFAERVVTVLCTSALGVFIASAGLLTLCLHARPGWADVLWDYPQWVLTGLICLWLAAMSVQTVSRKHTAVVAAPAQPAT